MKWLHCNHMKKTIKIEIIGYEVIEKIAVKGGNSSRMYQNNGKEKKSKQYF